MRGSLALWTKTLGKSIDGVGVQRGAAIAQAGVQPIIEGRMVIHFRGRKLDDMSKEELIEAMEVAYTMLKKDVPAPNSFDPRGLTVRKFEDPKPLDQNPGKEH